MQALNIKTFAAARADAGADIAGISTIKKGKPMLVGEKVPYPHPGPAGTKTLLHD